MSRRRSLLTKFAVGGAAVALLALLFVRTLQQTTSAPYVLRDAHLAGWELTLDPPLGPDGPLLALTPPAELPLALFQQVFDRTMESMSTPPAYGITLIRRSEFSGGLAATMTADELLALAREAGLGAARPLPRCVAEVPAADPRDPGRTFFALFDVPELDPFRERVARLVVERGGDPAVFDAAPVVPAVYLAATGREPRGWPQLGAPAEAHCAAPLASEP